MRLFVALVPPSSIRERLARTRDALRQVGADVKWVETDNIHLTLKFLGAVEPARLNSIQDALARATMTHPMFEVRYIGCGVFPNRRRPRVVWVGMTGDLTRLAALQGDVETALEPVGFGREGRPFKAHVTLGRVRSESQSRRLLERLDALRAEDQGSMWVEAISLMESQLSPRGPTYRRIMDFPLQAP